MRPNPNARQPDESFEDYKTRRTAMNKAIRRYLRGTFIWISKQIKADPTEVNPGYTYIKAKYGPLLRSTPNLSSNDVRTESTSESSEEVHEQPVL